MSLHRVGLLANGLLQLNDLLRLLAYRTNGRTGFLLAICVCFFCILRYFERVALAVCLALLTRLRLVLARRLRALLLVLVGYLSCRANPCVRLFVMCMSMLTPCKA